ncbi:MAG: carboxypeptidase regulatory-like domain-containing protein [Planctomycetes bacterium]|nr:carboxypeptidase regulatory-like domain-containing protein [Planctomycetota bacterium]
MARGRSSLMLAMVATLSVCQAGCSKHSASVSGNVTLDGKPLATGVVNFTPAATGASAYANIGADGRYALQTGAEAGLEPGAYKVTVAANATADQAAAMGIKVGRDGIMPLLTPPRYADVSTTPLVVDVKAGRQEIDLALEADKRGKK